jgi:hypothetical protein
VDEGQGKRGWLLLRQSLHDPLLVLNVESDTPGGASWERQWGWGCSWVLREADGKADAAAGAMLQVSRPSASTRSSSCRLQAPQEQAGSPSPCWT